MAKPDRPAKGKARYSRATKRNEYKKDNKFSASGMADTIRARQSRNNRTYSQMD